jgi:hypothetical protein
MLSAMPRLFAAHHLRDISLLDEQFPNGQAHGKHSLLDKITIERLVNQQRRAGLPIDKFLLAQEPRESTDPFGDHIAASLRWVFILEKETVFQIQTLDILGFGIARLVVIDVAIGTSILFF